MKALSETPTSQILAEWEIYHAQVIDPTQYGSNGHEWAEACVAIIASELDRRAAGLEIEHGQNFTEIGLPMDDPYSRIEDRKIVSNDLTDEQIKAIENSQLREIRDRITWLLMKGGANE